MGTHQWHLQSHLKKQRTSVSQTALSSRWDLPTPATSRRRTCGRRSRRYYLQHMHNLQHVSASTSSFATCANVLWTCNILIIAHLLHIAWFLQRSPHRQRAKGVEAWIIHWSSCCISNHGASWGNPRGVLCGVVVLPRGQVPRPENVSQVMCLHFCWICMAY
jgi:hypothetical protein